MVLLNMCHMSLAARIFDSTTEHRMNYMMAYPKRLQDPEMPFISEMMAKNTETLADKDGEFSDYIKVSGCPQIHVYHNLE